MATPTESKRLLKVSLAPNKITDLEKEMDEMNEVLPAMTHFILPAGSKEVSYHVCRTVARRAERKIVEMTDKNHEIEQVVVYMSRLSDFFFVLARKLTADNSVKKINGFLKFKLSNVYLLFHANYFA